MIVLIAVLALLAAAAVAVVLAARGESAAAGALIGVALGALGGWALSAQEARRRDKDARRASALLWRNDFYSYWEWMARSSADDVWRPEPHTLGTDRDLASIAAATEGWSEWQIIIDARNMTQRVLERKNSGRSPSQAIDDLQMARLNLRDARIVLARIDGGPVDPSENEPS